MKIQFLILILMMFASVPLIADDNNGVCTVTLQPQSEDDPNDPEQLIAGSKRKLPGRPMVITITKDGGVTMGGWEANDNLVYSIINMDGVSIFTSEDDVEFSTYFFALQGEYLIKIEFGDKTYEGFVSL